MIKLITFTGVDASTSLTELARIAYDYPNVEFGVLVGTHSGADAPIFPSLDVVYALKHLGQLVNMNTAIHLCGSWARAVMRAPSINDALYNLCNGFDRVQVNLHADTWGGDEVDVKTDALVYFANNVHAEHVILQHRTGWLDVPIKHPKIEYLFDVSAGGGVESFEHWPAPMHDLQRMGYAGGLGPHNFDKALHFAEQHSDHALWFDMERNVRSASRFDVNKVLDVCRIAWGER